MTQTEQGFGHRHLDTGPGVQLPGQPLCCFHTALPREAGPYKENCHSTFNSALLLGIQNEGGDEKLYAASRLKDECPSMIKKVNGGKRAVKA